MLSSDDFGEKDKVRADDTYAIYNEAEWNEFKSMIEGGYTFAEDTIVLMCDLIGVSGIEGQFEGYFYGNGHWIQYGGCGLFAYGLNATVENLGIVANLAYGIDLGDGMTYAGGVFAYAAGCLVYNCEIGVTTAEPNIDYVGGIFGYSEGSSAQYCGLTTYIFAAMCPGLISGRGIVSAYYYTDYSGNESEIPEGGESEGSFNCGEEYMPQLSTEYETPKFTVTFDPNGGTLSSTQAHSMEVTYGGIYGAMPTPTYSGHTFQGWYTDTNFTTQVVYDTICYQEADHTLYAKWKSNVTSYTITFNSNGGSGTVASITASSGSVISLPTNSFTRTGYTANGWNATVKITASPSYASGAYYTVTGDMTFYANWNVKKKNVTLGLKFNETGTWDTTTRSGFSYAVKYSSTTYPSSTNSMIVTSATISATTTKVMRAGQTLDFSNITCPTGWVCVGYVTGTTTPPDSTSSAVTSLSPYLANNTTATTYYVCFKYVGLVLRYDTKLKYFYFEDGEMSQTAVSTYNTSFNTLLTNLYSSSSGSSFTANGITFMTQTYTYASGQNSSFSSYSGQRFLGFVMPTTRTVKLQNPTSSSLTYTSYTFTAGTTYWFRYDPIRWRVSDYGVASTNPPSAWDLIGETTANTKVVSDVLWWDAVHDGEFGVGDEVAGNQLYYKILNFQTKYIDFECQNCASATYSIDQINKANESNDKVIQTTHTVSKPVFAGLDELEINQSELNSYASALVCVLAGKNQDQFIEYWTRDIGQQIGCGTYVTKSGETVTNSFWDTQKGVRFAACMTKVGNTVW